MSASRTVTVADVVSSVISSDAGAHLAASQAGAAVQIALHTVIGLYCLGGYTLDIDLGNGYFLHCSLKPAPQWSRS